MAKRPELSIEQQSLSNLPATSNNGTTTFMFSDNGPKSVPYQHEDRQWDARFNVPTTEDLEKLTDGIKQQWDQGRLKYILIGGIEVGTRPNQTDYLLRHVHVAAIFTNRTSKRSILKSWNVKEGNGYYLVPRNRDLPYSGWRNHHIKDFSKVDQQELK